MSLPVNFWKKERRFSRNSYHQLVDVNSLSHESAEIGAEWLCFYQAVEQLGLEHCLQSFGLREMDRESFDILDSSLSLSGIRSRDGPVVTAKQCSELYHLPPGKVTRYHLYEVSKRLYKQKTEIESYLRRRTGELFSLEDQIWIQATS